MGAEPETSADLLEGTAWRCGSVTAGSCADPTELAQAGAQWLAARVPGTAAGALRDSGAAEPDNEHLDGRDWWFRCRFSGPPADAAPDGWVLSFGGLATLADVWLNGQHLLHSESMFASWRVPVDRLGDDNVLDLRFAALSPVLAERRPRPRWKSSIVANQNLRWLRTTLLGRQPGWAALPAPVGPWRPVRLVPVDPVAIGWRRVRTSCAAGPAGSTTGTVTVDLELHGPGLVSDGHVPDARLEVAERSTSLEVEPTETGLRLRGTVAAEDVERWWPHTHGPQPLYPVRVVVDGWSADLGAVGFRTVTADRSDGGFTLVVNDVPVFCRGAGWYPIDPVSLQSTDGELDAAMRMVRDAGMNMVRIPGGTVYEDDRIFDLCDRLGVLLWQDVMLGPSDPPDDPDFIAGVVAEVSDLLDRVGGSPSLAVLCGGEQLEEQPAWFGLPRDRWLTPVIHVDLPELVGREAPGLVYEPTAPSGGDIPTQSDVGTCHYVNVGIFLFPLDDLRRAAPRFVAEGFAFAIPPERETVDEEFGAGRSTGHESNWKRGVHRDAGLWFDLEDVRDHYAALLFDVDIATLWRSDHERALDLGRAAVSEVMATAVAEWRRTTSPCAGMLGLALRDLRPGPGWGLVDSRGRAKAPWYPLARGWAPVAVLATDEGGNGLAVHLVNDTGSAVEGTLEVGLHTAAHRVESASCAVVVPARGGTEVRAESLFDGFRDLTYAYRFGPRAYELVTADLIAADGRRLAGTTFLPGGPIRDVDPDVGLQALVEPADEGMWLLRISSRRFAQYVHIDVAGFAPDDSWFHLPPGGEQTVRLRAEQPNGRPPDGRVLALNSVAQARVAG